ncbi:MAG: hypothetical protein JNL83_27675 [Myxococcales bacterium]|nr:hypothetical protein [Myxococcales bacterium]
MRLNSFVVFTFTLLGAAACATDKTDPKGVVDESEPPSIPTELSKADASSKEIAVNVQSPHPYTNDLNRVFNVPYTDVPWCANQIRLHFKVLRTEASYDYVTVEPSPDPKQRFTGDRDNTWTSWFGKTGSGVPVRLESDESITRHGFEIDKLEWQGSAICPAIAYPQCAANTIDISPPLPACGCPGPRQCAPQATAEISHLTARGFNRIVHSVKGDVASETHPGPADGPETSVIGTLDQTKVNDLVKRASQLGLLHGPGYERAVPAGGTYEDFTIKAGAKTVTFIAGVGSQDPAVAQLIADFEALFTCGTPVGGLSCGTGYTCSTEGECVKEPEGCVCAEIYQPVCSTSSTTFGNACEAGCAGQEIAHEGECGIPGDQCGTIRGLPCLGDNKCRFGTSQFTYPFPDAGGVCVEGNYCDAPGDCTNLIHPAVPGAWACNQNKCAWAASIPWQPVSGFAFETAHPYASSTSVWKELTLPTGAQAMRLVPAGTFSLEANYDFLEVWSWVNGAWKPVKRYSGTTAPSATDSFTGRYHYLRFVSDSSVNKHGFKVTAEWR